MEEGKYKERNKTEEKEDYDDFMFTIMITKLTKIMMVTVIMTMTRYLEVQPPKSHLNP